MEIREYLEQKGNFNVQLLEYFDDQNHDISDIKFFQSYYLDHNISKDISEFDHLLRILANISKHHHRYANFYKKFDQILEFLKSDIKQAFTNIEIISIFQRNNRILLSLLKQQIISYDISLIQESIKEKQIIEHFYFWPEIKESIEKEQNLEDIQAIIDDFGCDETNEYGKSYEYDEEDISEYSEEDTIDFPYLLNSFEKSLNKFFPQFYENFDKKRETGENESYICQLIRNDSIVEFIRYVNTRLIPLSKYKIDISFFETNRKMILDDISLIDYVAFFGSVQIFKYLIMEKVPVTIYSLSFAIHGNNHEIISEIEHLLQKQDQDDYKQYFIEANKCYHNDIARYIEDNYLDQQDIEFKFKHILKKCNFELISTEFLTNGTFFYYLCKYNYLNMVKLLLKEYYIGKIINHKIIHSLFYVILQNNIKIMFSIII